MEAEISFNRLGVAVTGCAMSEDRVRQPAYEALCVCPEHRCLGRVYNCLFLWLALDVVFCCGRITEMFYKKKSKKWGVSSLGPPGPRPVNPSAHRDSWAIP